MEFEPSRARNISMKREIAHARIQMAPVRIRLCLKFIILAAIFTTLTMVPHFAPVFSVSGPAHAPMFFVMAIVPPVLIGVAALSLIYVGVRERHPWSRIGLLVLCLGAAPLLARAILSSASGVDWLEVFLAVAAYGTLMTATLLAFSPACRDWFARRPTVPAADS